MKPTVSSSTISRSAGNRIRRTVGSSVANSLSSASTVLPVTVLSRVDLPALVYPTIATTGTRERCRRARC